MVQHTVSCPHCGLRLTIEREADATRIRYDPVEWRRLCRYPGLDSPALCLMQGGGSGVGGQSPGGASSPRD